MTKKRYSVAVSAKDHAWLQKEAAEGEITVTEMVSLCIELFKSRRLQFEIEDMYSVSTAGRVLGIDES